MEQTQITHSFEETQRLGEQFAQKVHGGDVVLFFGDLGAGKTTFMQGFAKGLGTKHRIISPTFIIMRTYDAHRNEIEKLYHLDLYRMESMADIDGLGFTEVLSDPKGVVAIEWPEKLGEHLPKSAWVVKCTYVNDTDRLINISKRG